MKKEKYHQFAVSPQTDKTLGENNQFKKKMIQQYRFELNNEHYFRASRCPRAKV